MLKRLFILIICLMLLPAAPALSEGCNIVATFYPIYAMAANLLVGVEGAELSCLAPPATGCLHDRVLMPSDVMALSGADVLLMNGAGMESYLSGVISQLPELSVVDASYGIELLPSEHEHEEHEHDEHEHGEYNAHIWLSVPNAVQMLNNLADGLISALPEYADKIAENRDAYVARLYKLDEALRAALAPYSGRSVITFHEAFDYFATEYGLNVAATLVSDTADRLSAGDMARLCSLVKELDTPPLFTEPAYECPAAELIALETGANVYSLDPATTGTLDMPDVLTAYEDALHRNLNVLVEAFSN